MPCQWFSGLVSEGILMGCQGIGVGLAPAVENLSQAKCLVSG